MALDPSKLGKDFKKIFDKPPPSGALAAKKFAKAYEDYAKNAIAGAYGPPVLTGSERNRLEVLLRSAMTAPVGAAPILAAAWATGLQLFWAGVLFGPGAATLLIGLPIALGGLTALYLNIANTKPIAAYGTATILDVATRTLLVVGPLGPQPVL